MKNRFNNISSKEWLPFQKSWFLFDNDEVLYNQHLRFFIKYDDPEFVPNVYYWGDDKQNFKKIAKENKAIITDSQHAVYQYVFVDLRKQIADISTLDEYYKIKSEILSFLNNLFDKIKHRRFVSILIQNKEIDGKYLPFAWDLAYSVASIYTLKDEKIACLNTDNSQKQDDNFFVLNFRKDENSPNSFENIHTKLLDSFHKQSADNLNFTKTWGIVKPPRRNKKEILHPAKFPENIIREFIEVFTEKGQNVFDPMSGTGSTQLAALQTGRNGYGTELSELFADIANERLAEYLNNPELENENVSENVKFNILNKDIRDVNKDDFPVIDYIITSPPYWNMLNMKGAENQAKRKKKGLKLNYSDDDNDLGNVADYELFIDELVEIYFKIIELLKPGQYMTIIVKNIKKKGKNYPFAWDLSQRLAEKMILLPEFYWLQDDINIAPYGYGNTFVSNTFHQYCLNFR
ncbi:MAG: DNA methyltransferase, partial [Bacteroidota bacterium]|nr:DNA methyltransferase [Bacteroidota bacterium]